MWLWSCVFDVVLVGGEGGVGEGVGEESYGLLGGGG